MTNNTTKTPIVDRNGKATHVHKKVDQGKAANSRINAVSVAPSQPEPDEVTEAVESAKEHLNKKFRIGNQVVKLVDVESLGKTIDGTVSLRITVERPDQTQFDFVSHKGLHDMTLLRSDSSYYKTTQAFSADTTDLLGTYLGTPFTSSSVFSLALLDSETSESHELKTLNADKPILTGFGISIDLEGGTGMKYEFTGIDGEQVEYVIPDDKKDELKTVELQPLRHKWNLYDPDVL